MPNLHEYLTIKSAAELLGVTQNTLRNWGAGGKIVEYRHPINNYRLYRAQDLKRLLTDVARSGSGKSRERRGRKPK